MTIPNSDDINLEEAMPWLLARGFPTFDEFRKNPDKWRIGVEHLFESAEASTQVFRKSVKTQKYSWKDQYVCESLEQLERIAKEEGFTPLDLEMEPIVKPIHGTHLEGQVEIIIRFWPKNEFRAQGKVVSNDHSAF